MKKIFTLLLCLVVFIGTLAGCGDNAKESKETSKSSKVTDEKRQEDIEETKEPEAIAEEDTEDGFFAEEEEVRDLTEYYDTSRLVGSPYLAHGYVIAGTNSMTNVTTYSFVLADSIEELYEVMQDGSAIWFSVDESFGLNKQGGEAEFVMVDNGTPDDLSDDQPAAMVMFNPEI